VGNVRGSEIKGAQPNSFARTFNIFSILVLLFILQSCDGRDLTDGGNDTGITTQFNLSVTSDELEVTLNWDRISDENLDLYNLYRSENEGEFILYDTLNISISSFIDTEVAADIIYEYKITALFDGERESDPSKIVRIIPGFSTLWVLDFQGDVLRELTHDGAHLTGLFFDNLTLPVALDIDERNGYIYFIDGQNKTLNLIFEGMNVPAVLTDTTEEKMIRTFEDPTDIDFDMLRNELWIAGGSTGDLYHFTMINESVWDLTEILNTGGNALDGQLDLTRGDYWVVNGEGKSIEIFRRKFGVIIQVSSTGYASGSLTLALDAERATAYVIDRSNGDIFWVEDSGQSTLIANVKNAILGAVVPSTGHMWLIADEDENGIGDLIKLSITGNRILEIMNLYSDPMWIGINPVNMNVTVLNTASGEVKIEILSNNTGERLSSFNSINIPGIARIVDKRNSI